MATGAIMDRRMTPTPGPSKRDRRRGYCLPVKTRRNLPGVALEKSALDKQKFRLAGQGPATGLVKQPSGRNNKGVLGRFRGAGFGQEFPNEEQKNGGRNGRGGKKKRERDRENAAEKAKPGSPRHVNDRPGVNCGGGGLVVSGDDCGRKAW